MGFYMWGYNNLVRRVWEHREGVMGGFTKEHDVKQLVHYEMFEDAPSAIAREKQLKHWKRAWKVKLIMEANANWRDLYSDITT